ncbi:MAG: redoxin domain-containing protein [Chitinophagaceae bacterium]
MSLQPGIKAPDFSLYNTEKEKVSLQDYKGRKLLILFFPLAFTSTCTKELCSVRDGITKYADMDADVVAISVDSIFTLLKFREEQHLNFPLLSDFNKETSEAYGSLYTTFGFDMKGVSKRSAFVVDREGILVYTEVLENAGEVPDFDKIVAAIKSIA